MIRRLGVFARPHARTFATALAFLVATTMLDAIVIPVLVTALLLGVIDASMVRDSLNLRVFGRDLGGDLGTIIGGAQRPAWLLGIAAAGLVVIVAKCVCQVRRIYLSHKFGLLIARDLRAALFAHLMRQAPAFHQRSRSGALLSRVTADVVSVQELLGPPIFEAVQAPFALAVALAVMGSLSWKLTLVTLCLAPVIAWVIARIGRAVRRLTVSRQDKLAALNAYLAERLSGVRLVQTFGRQRAESRAMASLNDTYFRGALQSVKVSESLAPLSELVAGAGMLVGVLAGAFAVLGGELPPEHFVLFFAVAPTATTHAARLGRVGRLRHQLAGAVVRLFELLDEGSEIADAPGAAPLVGARGRVTFERVSFGYQPGVEVLSDITLDVPPGECVAIVGPSGAGKSTLLHLVPRFFDATAGRVLVDGQDVRRLTLESLRRHIGIVSQDTVLFAETIASNIRYARPDASDADVLRAARAAHALEFVEALPDGFETVIGERGLTLSGGERQRIAIARAILLDPRILILDEATSALDPESDRLVQDALSHLIRDRTTFVVAHRFTTIQDASRVVVLSSGRIIECGPRAALLASDGLYRRLHDLQALSDRAAH